ncbi:MAG: CRTAC1 family protein, partial [Planctomycetaceae bacterium]|nr:CRTAC1 family protein [Planctomycetaceae bacterium]
QPFFFGLGLLLLALLCSSGCSPEEPRSDLPPGGTSAEDPLPVADRPLLAPRNAAPSVSDPRRTKPNFVSVGESQGLQLQFFSDFVPDRFFLPEVMGGGVGCLDFDRDGWLDVFLPNGTVLIPDESAGDLPRDVLFRRSAANDRFEQVADAAGDALDRYGQGCAVADFDADGFADLYLTNYGANVLYHNNGDGTFAAVSADPVKGSHHWSTSCAWTDLNDDGLPDLYVVNYMNVTEQNIRTCDYNGIGGYCGPGEYDALQDEVFINQGDGTFREQAAELGFTAANGKGLAICVIDFDQDQRAEIYVANDMTENFLYSRSHSASTDASGGPAPLFQNQAGVAGCAVSESGMNEASMGVACADFDFDLQPDIYLTHFYHQKNTLYHNQGNLNFLDDSRRFRVTVTSNDFLGFGVVPFDFDTDGSMDLFVANGHVLGPAYTPNRMLPQLLDNVEGKWLDDISADAGDYFRTPVLGRGAAGIDFDNDGDIDLCVSHIDVPVALLENRTAHVASRVIGLLLEDEFRNVPVGGRVEIHAGHWHRCYPVTAGGSYLSSPDPRVLIPVPDDVTEPVTIRIHWPSGTTQELTDPAAGGYWYVRQGRTEHYQTPFADSL